MIVGGKKGVHSIDSKTRQIKRGYKKFILTNSSKGPIYNKHKDLYVDYTKQRRVSLE